MRSAQEDEACNTKSAIDLVSAVEEFHKLSYQDLSKLIREAENGIIRYTKQNGSLLEINMESMARNLDLHLISKLLSFKRDEQHLKYLLSGVRLLHGLYDLQSRHPKLEQVLSEDVNVSERVLDLIFFINIFISNFKQKLHASSDKVLFASALLASSLYLLKACISSQWNDLTYVLLAHPKVDVFTSVAFHAVRVIVFFLQVKLSAQHTDTHNVDEVYHLCLHCEASIQFIHSLCQQKLFRESLVKNKDLCKEGGALWLVQDIMKLPQCEDSILMKVVTRLKSKILSIMLQLCEVESIFFLDLTASTTEGLALAKSTISEVLELLKIMFCGDVNGVSPYCPRGILQLNAMTLVDILSDDSNFRSYIVSKFTEVLTTVFLLPHREFLSSWCSSDSEPTEEDVTLNYDSFSAAGQVLGVMSASRGSKSEFIASRASQTPYAHHKTSLLVKIVANLTCFDKDLCKEEEGLFLNEFFQCLQKELFNSPDGVAHGGGGAERAAVASRNLLSLLVHAGSLATLRYLNEDDVTLFRSFIRQLEKLITPPEPKIHRVKEVDNRGLSSSPGPRRSSPDGYNISGNLNEGIAARRVDESERDGNANNIETIGSELSNMQLKNASDRMNNTDGVPEEEIVRSVQSEEKQLKKRKRNIMNDVQIDMMENVLLDEPDMQRRAASIQLWADKLSLHGPEITSYQLKNWLNNRKAKLARVAAKHTPIASSGGGSVTDHVSDSLGSPGDEFLEPSSYGPQGTHQKQKEEILRICGKESSETACDPITTSSYKRQNGQYVVLVDGKGNKIGKGNIHLAKGIWFGRNLQELGLCVVDVTDLEKNVSPKLPHPCDATGFTFDDAEMILGRKRILWASINLLLILTDKVS